MTNGTKKYDAIIIGSGQGGNPLARALAQAGWTTALIERKYVGGTCINWGCTPTKTMVASARVAYLARRGGDYGVEARSVAVDMMQVRERKRAIVNSFRTSNRDRLENTESLDLLMGEARFTGSHQIEVNLNEGGTLQLEANQFFIDTGARPRIVPIPGLDKVSYLDSTSIMELEVVPDHLIILGGGYIGMEFSQMFRRFGSQVTIVQKMDQLLGREDADVAEEVLNIIQEDGSEVLLGSEAQEIRQGDGGTIEMSVKTPDGERQLSGSHLLVAIGRVPNTDSLNLEAAGIQSDDRGFIQVNDRLETNVPGIYALGDVKGGPAFTHISYDDFRVLRNNLIGDGNATITNRLVPYVVYMDPELGRIGLSESQARAHGRNIRVAKMPMSWVARALEMEETRGFMKAVIDADTDQIIGAAILGVHGGEIMSMLQIAMMGQVPYQMLRDGIFTHPTLAEALNTLFTSFEE